MVIDESSTGTMGASSGGIWASTVASLISEVDKVVSSSEAWTAAVSASAEIEKKNF